jgi:signal transduction histidine kinase
MAGTLSDLVRANQEVICAQGVAQIRQEEPDVVTVPEDVLQRHVAAILEALVAYWEQGEVTKVHAWVEQQAHLSAVMGVLPSQVVGRLDRLSMLIRSTLATCLTQPSALLTASAQLDEGVCVLRRCYLDAYFGRSEQRFARLSAHEAKMQQRLESLIEHLPEGVLMVEGDFRLVLANPVAREYLTALAHTGVGELLTHLGGRPLAELLDPPPEGLSHEVQVDGLPYRVFEVEARPVIAGATSGGWVLVIRDVTEDRQVRERVQQQERLAAVGQLAAGIAHDFNNLLTGIIGYADMLQKRPDMPEPARTRLARIVEQGERGAHLVRQILDFSRTSVSQLLPLDLVPFLKEATKFLERTIPESTRIVLEIEPGTYFVRADPPQIQQVLTNLAVNAYDAMPKGGHLTIRLCRFTRKPGERPPCLGMPAGDWVVLAVSDTGQGMPPEVVPRIFEPFFTTKEPGKGTGLGLAQVYGIVKQHEGYIRAESQEGQGATITIYLPVLTGRQEVPSGAASGEIPRGCGETVLLVEDEPVVLEVCSDILQELGYRVLTATNGQQALEVCAAHKDEIVLALIDMVMPVMGGLQLFQALRELHPDVKAVITTGYALAEEGQKLLAQGISAWIQKPLNPAQLAQIIRQVLQQ